MLPAPFTNPVFRAFNAAGAPLAGGKLYSYSAGTTTPQALFAPDGVTPLPNPVVLDANGEAQIAFGPLPYKVILKDASDVTQWTRDDLTDDRSDILSDLANTTLASRGAGLVGYGRDVVYPRGTVGRRLNDLEINALWYLSDAELADVVGNIGSIDVSAKIQAALDAANGNVVYCPRGAWRIGTTVTSYNAPLTTHPGVRIRGDGPNSTRFMNRVSGGPCFDFDHRVGSTTYNNQVFSSSSFLEQIGIFGDPGTLNSDGLRVMGLWNLRIDGCIINSHTRYGIHFNADTNYNPDISASTKPILIGTAIRYNKIGIYAPITHAVPTMLLLGCNVDWNTDIGIYHCSNYMKMLNGACAFNGYGYSGDYSPSLSYGGYIIANNADGTASGCMLDNVEIDGNRPQQIYACSASMFSVKNCKFGVRKTASETNKYVCVFGADVPAGSFSCINPVFEGNTVTINAGDYSSVTTGVIVKFKAGSRFGYVGTNMYYITGTGFTAGTNLFYVSEDVRTGGNSGGALGVRYLEQNAEAKNSAYPVQYKTGIYESIPDDGVVSFKPPRNVGMVMVSGGSSFVWGVIGFTVGTGVTFSVADSTGVDLGATNTVLTGTTGVDGRLTVGAANGVLYIENRLGSATLVSVSVITSQIGF